jgi:hypothetical protein
LGNILLFGGFTQSDVSGDVTEPKFTSAFDTDFWILLADSAGDKIWDKRLGGTQSDQLNAMTATYDGKFVVAGSSLSDSSGNKTQDSRGGLDYWMVKVDATGNKIWDKRFGGDQSDNLTVILEAGDHGFLLAGWSTSSVSGDKTRPSWGDKDFWIVKTDSTGNKLWDKRYGGINEDWLIAATSLSNGQFILGGFTASPAGGDITETSRGYYDLWIIKIDSSGNKIWDKRYGGTSDEDEMGKIIATQDGGYLISGTSYSDAGADKSENNLGMEQGWAIKTDSMGIIQWDKTLFTIGHDETSYAVQTPEGCYVFALWSQADAGGL